jgi:preprotein translocase subunit YajC
VNQILLSATALLAEADAAGPAADAQKGPGGLGGGWGLSLLTLWLPIIALFYFLILRPQRKEQSTRANLLANLKKTDRVVTVGGIYGTVANVNRDADEVTLKIDENTKIRVTMGAISRVLEDKDKPSGSASTGSS